VGSPCASSSGLVWEILGSLAALPWVSVATCLLGLFWTADLGSGGLLGSGSGGALFWNLGRGLLPVLGAVLGACVSGWRGFLSCALGIGGLGVAGRWLLGGCRLAGFLLWGSGARDLLPPGGFLSGAVWGTVGGGTCAGSSGLLGWAFPLLWLLVLRLWPPLAAGGGSFSPPLAGMFLVLRELSALGTPWGHGERGPPPKP